MILIYGEGIEVEADSDEISRTMRNLNEEGKLIEPRLYIK